MKINENHWKSLKLIETHWNFLSGFINFFGPGKLPLQRLVRMLVPLPFQMPFQLLVTFDPLFFFEIQWFQEFLAQENFLSRKITRMDPPPRFTKNPILVKKFIKKTMIDPKASRFLIPAGGAGISGQGKFFIWIPWHTTESMESMESMEFN